MPSVFVRHLSKILGNRHDKCMDLDMKPNPFATRTDLFCLMFVNYSFISSFACRLCRPCMVFGCNR